MTSTMPAPGIPVAPDQPTVAVVGVESIATAALVALVERSGLRAVQVPPTSDDVVVAHGIIAREPNDLRQARIGDCGHPIPTVFLSTPDRIGRITAYGGGPSVRVIPAEGPESLAYLERFLTEIAERAPRPARVHVTPRECEILHTYTLGATLRQTSRLHRIAESTVREHYRRVARRYEDAGRPVGNKAQMLLQLVADGWIDSAAMRESA